MVTGIEIFREKFSRFEKMYTLIGGVACDLLMDDAGLDFRTTKDFDIVIIIEVLDATFGKAFWEFIKEGGYQIREKSNGEPEFYRFQKPFNLAYPREIELFSRRSNIISAPSDSRLMPVHISEDLSSLSAILLNDEYYEFLKSGLVLINGIQVLNYTHIIPFKAKAWLDLKMRKENGESVDSKKTEKHKRDVFRLSQLITGNDRIELSGEILNDMTNFILQMETETVDLKNMKIRGSKNTIIDTLKNVYLVNNI